jgi:hypothetical protein
MRLYNDWIPETQSLLETLQRAGFTLLSGNNGENRFAFTGDLPAFIAELSACDESHLFIKKDTEEIWLLLVFGNSPGELVADFGVSRSLQIAELVDAATASHYEKWEGKAQPTLTEEQYCKRHNIPFTGGN